MPLSVKYRVIYNFSILIPPTEISKANGICPIVEPEVMMDGDHDIETCARVSERVYSEVFKACHECGVLLEGILFKPNMITSGNLFSAISLFCYSYSSFRPSR